jgi:hypothetical protein
MLERENEPRSQHTVIASNRAVATAAYFIRPVTRPGFAISCESKRNVIVDPV